MRKRLAIAEAHEGAVQEAKDASGIDVVLQARYFAGCAMDKAAEALMVARTVTLAGAAAKAHAFFAVSKMDSLARCRAAHLWGPVLAETVAALARPAG